MRRKDIVGTETPGFGHATAVRRCLKYFTLDLCQLTASASPLHIAHDIAILFVTCRAQPQVFCCATCAAIAAFRVTADP